MWTEETMNKNARDYGRCLDRAKEIIGYSGTDDEIWDLADELYRAGYYMTYSSEE